MVEFIYVYNAEKMVYDREKERDSIQIWTLKLRIKIIIFSYFRISESDFSQDALRNFHSIL